MKNLEKAQPHSSKRLSSKDFWKDFRKGLRKLGISDIPLKTPSRPTNEYTTVLRPFAKRNQENLK